jgi:hypothetical protein
LFIIRGKEGFGKERGFLFLVLTMIKSFLSGDGYSFVSATRALAETSIEPPPLLAVPSDRSHQGNTCPADLVGEGSILLPMSELQEVARKPGVRHGGLSPAGVSRSEHVWNYR